MNIENIFCPICNFKTYFLFRSKLNRNIFHCTNKDCGHFFTPARHLSQGICNRDNDIERESDDFLKIYDERNVRLFEFLKK